MKRRSNVAPQAYKRTGLLAVHPQAFLELFVMPESRENEERNNVVIVDICGPLTQHDDGFFDSYEAIRTRVQGACQSAAAAIVLRIDSPGGDCAGCFDTARALRAMCTAAGKPLWAHVDGKACSAAYALAAAASTICIGDTGIVGSIGIVSARLDVSAKNAAEGVRVAFVASGARKVDGNPDQPLSEAELKATQALVDSMADTFFELVAELRGKPAASIAGLQAAVFHGEGAKGAGLVDELLSFDAMLAAIASGGTVMSTSAYDKAKAALEEAAKGEDANAEAAKRALAAMEVPKSDSEPDGDEPKEKKDDESAQSDAPKPDKDDDDKKAAATSAPGTKAAASAQDIALEALAEVHKLKAARAQDELKAERKNLLASRPDFSPDFLAVLKTADIATVRKFVKDLPKAPGAKPAATTVVAATRGAGQGGQGTGHGEPAAAPVAAASEMDRAMGLTTTVLACRREGNALKFGVMEVPAAQNAPAGGAK